MKQKIITLMLTIFLIISIPLVILPEKVEASPDVSWFDSFEGNTHNTPVLGTPATYWNDGGAEESWWFGDGYTTSSGTGCGISSNQNPYHGTDIVFTESSSTPLGAPPAFYSLESDEFTLVSGDNLTLDFQYHCYANTDFDYCYVQIDDGVGGWDTLWALDSASHSAYANTDPWDRGYAYASDGANAPYTGAHKVRFYVYLVATYTGDFCLDAVYLNVTSSGNSVPTQSSESPTNQSTGVSTTPTLSVVCSDSDASNTLNATWWSNSTDGETWVHFASNWTSFSSGTNIKQTNSNFSAYDTTYWWSVNLTDGYNWTNATYYFTTGSEPVSWWNNNWLYSKSITINSSQVPSDLTNFPVLIHNTSTDFIGRAQFDGEDFAFVNSVNTTQYYHDLDEYNGATGELIAWVNVTSLSADTDTVIWIYYGNSGCGAQEDTYNTWDSNYVGVYHMNDTTSTCVDSAVGNNGTYYDSLPTRIAGKIGYGQDFDGTSDYISLPAGTFVATTVTISMWQKETNNDATHVIYSCAEVDGDASFHKLAPYDVQNFLNAMYAKEAVNIWDMVDDGTRDTNVGFYAHMFDGSSSQLWHDTGVVDTGGAGTTGNVFVPTLFYIGCTRTSASYYLGWMDEFRVSNIKRTDDWMLTTYNTSNSPETFLSFGTQQAKPGVNNPPSQSNPVPSNGATDVDISTTILSIDIEDTDGDLMNFTIQTFPNIGSQDNSSAPGEGNGTKNCTISGLTYDITYTWYVNLSDGYNWTNATYSFTVEEAPSVYIIKGLEGTNKNITWTGDAGTTVWSNATSGNGSTMEINMSINTSHNVTGVLVYCDDLDATITAGNITMSVSSDNSSFGSLGAFTNGGSNITINSANWNSSTMGANPFLGAGLTNKTTSIFCRFKLAIQSGVSTGTYSQSDWKVYIGNYTDINTLHYLDSITNESYIWYPQEMWHLMDDYIIVGAEQEKNVTIMDISNREIAPVLVSTIYIAGQPRKMDVSEDDKYIFVGTQSGGTGTHANFTIINITDINNPTIEGNLIIESGSPVNVIGCSYVDSTETAFVTCYSENKLYAIDCSDKTTPTEISNITIGNSPHGVWANETVAFVLGHKDDKVHTVDVTDTASMSILDDLYSTNYHQCADLWGEYNPNIYVASLDESIAIFNISDPNTIVETSCITYTNDWMPVSVEPNTDETLMYVVNDNESHNEEGTLEVYDITDKANPILLDSITNGTDGAVICRGLSGGLVVKENYVYVGYYDWYGVSVFRFDHQNFTASYATLSFGGKVEIAVAIDGDVFPDTWSGGNVDVGKNIQENFTFWQNGSSTIDITIGVNETLLIFVNYASWLNLGHDRYCANFTINNWGSETSIEPGYPPTSALKSGFAPGNFDFGVRIWMPRTVTNPNEEEDFKIVLVISEST